MKRIGIFGGTFNPIHTAHLVIAESALEQYGLERIMFLPNASPPHKVCEDMADAAQRLEMTKRAIEGNDSFFVCDYEIKNGGLSYTVDTLTHFKKEYDEIYFIIGGDSVRDFPTWYMPEKIAKLCTLLVYPRGDIDTDFYIENVKKLFGASVYKISAPQLDISSSDIRERIKSGRSVRYLIPDGVREIIKKNNLYRK